MDLKNPSTVCGNILLLIAACIVTLLCIEGVLRVAGISYPLLTHVDSILGWKLNAGVSGYVSDEGNRSFIRINSQGWRDRERHLEKPEGTIRIAVLGDSFTEARQVENNETFTQQLEPLLSACSEREVEVLNFGVSGYGPLQEKLVYEHVARSFAPDIVVVMMTLGNDISNVSPTIEGRDLKPYPIRTADGALSIDWSFTKSQGFVRQQTVWHRSLTSGVNASRVVQLFYRARQILRAKPPSKRVQPERGLDAEVTVNPPPTPAWQEAWNDVRDIFKELLVEVHADGREMIIVTDSSGFQVYPDVQRRKQWQEETGMDQPFGAEEHMQSIAAELDIKFLSLAQPMADMAEESGRFFHGGPGMNGTGHWNALGHATAAKLMEQPLCDTIKRRT